MNKEQFWKIIDTVNLSFSGKDQELRLRQMVESLLCLPLDEIMDWHLILTEYKNAAYRNDLWAASAALGAHCTDDGFIDFRSWLISRGKEVYMNAMQNPDSLATVPLEGEDLNFGQFGYVPHYAYDKKVLSIDPTSKDTLLNALDNHSLAPQIIEDIHTELPKRQDIDPDWSMWKLIDLFPNIYKAQEPKDIKGFLQTGNIVQGYVYKQGQCMQYLFQYTPANIANFIGSYLDADKIVVTDVMDGLIMNTIGIFIDRCPDKELLECVKKVLLPILMGKTKAQPFFCPTRDAVDAYYEANNPTE